LKLVFVLCLLTIDLQLVHLLLVDLAI
jgi:hypothetical protein